MENANFFLKDESAIRFGALLTLFIVLAVLETVAPRRPLLTSKLQRWFANLTIVVLNPLAVFLIFPILPMGLALVVSEQNWGLLNQLAMPFWLKVACGVLLLDLAVYMQHVLHHAIPVLWRLHMVHHADIDFDMTTGLRFHPVEIVVSMAVKLATVAALGAPSPAVLIFENYMVIGLPQFRDPQQLTLPHLLIMPFVGNPGRVPVNRH
jgi:sterol desaturase/sphingolipid hydroxylase (fatty acid hydroxylase superfamily)